MQVREVFPQQSIGRRHSVATVKGRWGKAGPHVTKWIVEINSATVNMASISETKMVCPSCQQLNIVRKCKRKNLQNHEHCLNHLKKERNTICGKADHDHYMEHSIIYGAIIIAIAHSLNFKRNNNRKSYSSLHMIEMQIINLKMLALQDTWCQTNITPMLMCSDL